MGNSARAFGVAGMLVLAACSSSEPPAGSERGPCYGNGTCNAPLVCLSGLCVRNEPVDAGLDAAMPADAGVPLDSDVAVDLGFDAGPLERRSYVVSELQIPDNATESMMFGLDLDGDGAVDNQLGQVNSALIAAAGSGSALDFAAAERAVIDEGLAILLVEVGSPAFTSGFAQGRALHGSDPSPAACGTPGDPLTCRMHFGGSAHFTVTPITPEVMTGSITGGRLELGPGASEVPIAFSRTPIWLPLVSAHLQAQVGVSGLTSGILAGGLRQSDLDTVFVPAFHASVVENITRDCSGGTCTAGSSGESLLALFDENHDGLVPLSEFQMNSLLQTLLRPDLDLYDATGAPGTDGVLDAFSVGIGFTAVGAVFTTP